MSEILSYEKFVENLRAYLLDAFKSARRANLFLKQKMKREWLRMETVYLWNVV